MAFYARDLAPLNAALAAVNNKRWLNIHFLPHFIPLAAHVADEIISFRARYETISLATGVPWELIGVIHDRECSMSWLGNLAQGDPWNKMSIHDPSGRGPFKSWDEAAIDALIKCPPFASKWSDWSMGGKLTLLELYNGLGYAHMGHPSPYIWSGTDQYSRGKYTSDHHFDPNAVDRQLGCAIMLSQIMEKSNELGRNPQSDGQGVADGTKPSGTQATS